MNIDWTSGDQTEIVLKLALWFFYSAGEAGLQLGSQLVSGLLPSGLGRFAVVVPVVLVAGWVIYRLLKLLMIGGFITAVALVGLHFYRV